jgi:hypothetical protein
LPGYSFVCSSFEEYENDLGSFDLIYAATCFHWLKPGLRFKKAALLLAEQGGLAIFTDRHTKNKKGFFTEVQSIYRSVAPELILSKSGAGTEGGEIEENSLTLVHESEHDRQIVYTSDAYIGLLKTFSGHILLGEERLNELCAGIRELIDSRHNGRIAKTLTTSLSIYRRAQPHHSADRSQPFRSLTIPMSAAAGSHR